MKKIAIKKKYIKIQTFIVPKSFIYVLIFINLLSFFGIFLLLPHPSKGDVFPTGNEEDTCGFIKVGLAQSPTCSDFSNQNSGVCKNPTGNPTNQGIASQTLTISLKSLNGATHKVSG